MMSTMRCVTEMRGEDNKSETASVDATHTRGCCFRQSRAINMTRGVKASNIRIRQFKWQGESKQAIWGQDNSNDKGSHSKQYEWWTRLLKRITWWWTDMTKMLKKRDGDESILSKWQQRRRRLKRWRGGGRPPAEPLPTTSHVTLSMTTSLSSSSPPSSSSSSFSSLLMSTFWFVCRNPFAS